MADQKFASFAHDGAGSPVAFAKVELFDRNTESPVRATTQTNALGYWAISHSTEGRFDVKISKDSWIDWQKYDRQQQFETAEVKTMRQRGSDNAFDGTIAVGALAADKTYTFRDATGVIYVGLIGWASVSGAGVLQGTGFNITSVARDSLGIYTITWDTDFADVNYAACAVAEGSGPGENAEVSTITVGSMQVKMYDNANSLSDEPFHVMAVGDQ